jgi:diadenosine tetraphosphatase ApaH/serine/threonine PP2A family protein phosphatase
MDIDRFIEEVKAHKDIDESDMICVLRIAQEILFAEGTFVNVDAPITICGDVHGQFYDLLELFSHGGDPSTTHYLFLGDYVDRGYFSLQCFALLISYKIKYRTQFFMLRGNHECRNISRQYGFYDEIVKSYGHPGLWRMCNSTFDMLPMAALVSQNTFCMHGGLSPHAKVVEQFARLDRRREIPSEGAISDICWSDPDPRIESWMRSDRGAGWLFGRRPVVEFCRNNRLVFLVRAHQMVHTGYEENFEGKMATVWSAPNYCYQVGNDAAVLRLGAAGEREVVVFKAVPTDRRRVRSEDWVGPYFV